MNKMDKIFVCSVCGEEFVPQDEQQELDECCKFHSYGFDFYDEYLDMQFQHTGEYRTCNCEDYPCCGH